MGRILEVRKNTILVESINYNGQLEIVEISGKALKSIQTSDLAETRFKLFKNKGLKRIDAINTPETNVEERLQRQGYEKKDIEGMNIVNYLKQLGSILIIRINPFLTHVDDFAIQLKSHVQHIRRGIELQNEHIQHKLAILSILEKEIESAKKFYNL